MSIFSMVDSFIPENFVIINFYGDETCFAWRDKYLVVFPYGATSINSISHPVIVSPRDIKSIRGSGAEDGRVFIVCKPMGIYKLNQSLKFCILSHTGVGMASYYYQVFSVDNMHLYIKDKSTKNNRELFKLQETTDIDRRICEYVLNKTKTDTILKKAFQQFEDDRDKDICIIANGKKIFTITSSDVQLIHHCDNEIINIVGIFKEDTIVGFVLVAKNSAVLVYVNDNRLIFKKIYLDSEVRSLCAGINLTSEDIIWIAHVDDENIYYSSNTISTDTFKRNGTKSLKLLSIMNYKNETIIGLNDNKDLLKYEIPNTILEKTNCEEYFNLKPDMLKGSDKIMNDILERAKELQQLNEILIDEQEKLKRINIYAHKQAIIFTPIVKVERIAGKVFLRITFGNALPINCHVVVSLQSALRIVYSMKLVEDTAVVVDIPVDIKILDTSLRLNIDLVTMANESKPWCLIRNYTKNPDIKPNPISEERARFLRAKLAALRKLTSDGNFNMKQLKELKSSIRREL